MLIRGTNGVAVTLRPLRWQFPPDIGPWDDRWLVIGGTVDLGDRRWSFTDPCLLIDEARALAQWLRAAEGRIDTPGTPGDEPEPSLSFTEPALALSIAARTEDGAVVRVYFTSEAAPPWLRDNDPHLARHTVDLQLLPGNLMAAADQWTEELDTLPDRPWVDPAGPKTDQERTDTNGLRS